jgi:hypothetical protein
LSQPVPGRFGVAWSRSARSSRGRTS